MAFGRPAERRCLAGTQVGVQPIRRIRGHLGDVVEKQISPHRRGRGEPLDSERKGASSTSNKKIRRIIPMFLKREDNGFHGSLRAPAKVLRRERSDRRDRERRSAGVPAPLLRRGLLRSRLSFARVQQLALCAMVLDSIINDRDYDFFEPELIADWRMHYAHACAHVKSTAVLALRRCTRNPAAARSRRCGGAARTRASLGAA